MNWKNLLTVVVLAPFVALLGGVGVLAYNISGTWDSRNTDALISGLIASCGMGGIVIAGLLAAIIGIPFAMRLMDRWREADRYAMPRALPGRGMPGGWIEHPPQLTDKQQPGQWLNQGPGHYDTWEDEQPAANQPGEWR